MTPAKIIAMMGRTGFIGGAFVDTPSTGGLAVPWPSGTQPGDVGIVYGCENNSSSNPTISTSGWTVTNPASFNGRLLTKVLAASDLTATITYSGTLNTALLVMVFRGFSGLTVLSNQGDTGGGSDGKSWTGFSKGASCRGLIFLSVVSGNAGAPLVITSPSLTSLQGSDDGTFATTSRIEAYYDLVPSEYTNGASVTITGYGSSYGDRAFVACELV